MNPRVAVLNPSISRANGGVAEAARRLTQEVARLHDGAVEVLGLHDAFAEADAPLWTPLHPRVFRPGPLAGYGFARGYRRALDTFDADVVHVHGLWLYPSLAARCWSARSGRPYVVSVHGMLDSWALANSRWKKRIAGWLFERENLRRAACVHAITRAEVEAIRDYGFRGPVCLIPNAVDVPAGRRAIESARKTLLYLGRLHPKKGLRALIEGWSRARAARGADAWRLVIAGWDQHGHEAELRACASGLGLDDSVEFAGPRFGAEKDAAYSTATAFILPSFSEGLPLVVLEAWAWSLPVVMTPACNLPQGFTAQAAQRIEPEAGDIARGLAGLFALPAAELAAMGARGRSLVERDFTWPRVASEMLEVYRWLAGGGPRPGCVSDGAA